MVHISENEAPSDLDSIIRSACERHELRLFVTGWTRKTFDIHAQDPQTRGSRLVARVESFATTSGEILVFDDCALAVAAEIGEALEKHFGVKEATIVRRSQP